MRQLTAKMAPMPFIRETVLVSKHNGKAVKAIHASHRAVKHNTNESVVL